MNSNQSNWHFVGASVVGTSHLRLGLPCQDSFGIKWLPSGEVLLAVSDGAGSAEKAEQGSDLVVQAALASLERLLATETPTSESDWRAVVQAAFREARTALIRRAVMSKSLARDYAATLMLVVLTASPKWTIGGLIGDCAAVALQHNGQLFSLCQPQKGQYANMTNFLTSRDALSQLDIQIRAEPVQAVALFSDGLLELALNIAQNKPYAPFFKPLFAFAGATPDEEEAKRQLEAFLNSERVNARTDDDKTLVLACRVGVERSRK